MAASLEGDDALDKGALVVQKARPPFARRPSFSETRQDVANHKSTEKRMRQTPKRRARNLRYLSTLRTYMKRVRTELDQGALDKAKETLPKAVTAITKAASKGIIHRNTASRYVSRLTKHYNRVEQSGQDAS